MNKESQTAQEQLADLTQTFEKENVQPTPEVKEYVRSHVRAVQDKLQSGKPVYENELEFIPKVKMWMRMPKEWREKYPSVEEMVKSEEMKNVTMSDVYEAQKRDIDIKQWLDLLHMAEIQDKELQIDLAKSVLSVFNSESKLSDLKKKALQLAKPDAAKVIAQNAIKFAEAI